MRNSRLGRTALMTGAAFVVLGTLATAKTNTLTGEFQNDDNATVEMKIAMKKVKKNKFKPKAIKSIEVAGLDFFCFPDGEEGEVAAKLDGPFPLKKEAGFDGPTYTFEFEATDDEGRDWTVRDLPDSDGVNAKGTFSRGSIAIDFEQPTVPPPGQSSCSTGESNIYTAEK